MERFPIRALLILLVSLAITLTAWWAVERQSRSLERARFEAVASEAVEELRDRMESHEQLLLSGVALLEASERVGHSEWASFVDRLEIDARFPAIQGLGFALRVQAGELETHERAIRREGHEFYEVRPPGARPEMYPIVYLEPFMGRNLRAFGYDMFAEPVRRAAMERARDTGQAALTGRVVLVQETAEDVQAGTLLYMPYYAGEPQDLAGRRAAIRGFVYSPYRMSDLMRGIFAGRLRQLCIALYDQDGADRDLLYLNQDCETGDLHLVRSMEMYGRQWVVSIRSTPALDAAVRESYPLAVLVGGIVISFLLMWAVRSMVAERRRRVGLAAANRELTVARAQAEAANAAKSRFLAAASHDLRQPLQTLGIYLHLLAERSGPDVGTLVRSAGGAFDATRRLLDSLFDLAALESGKIQPERREVDVAEVLGRIAAEARSEAQAKGLSLRQRVCHSVVETDPVMLERVLRNLVSNALKYTDTGGVLLACRVTPDMVRVKVADSGPGIPADSRELIFEDFYQLGNPERDPRRGVGLGLATVARLSRLLGYRLKVLSRLGRGSTFVVEIPRKPPLAEAEKAR